jgi:hypothetical protein
MMFFSAKPEKQKSNVHPAGGDVLEIQNNILDIPDDVLNKVIEYSNKSDQKNIVLTNKIFNNVYKEGIIDKLRQLYDDKKKVIALSEAHDHFVKPCRGLQQNLKNHSIILVIDTNFIPPAGNTYNIDSSKNIYNIDSSKITDIVFLGEYDVFDNIFKGKDTVYYNILFKHCNIDYIDTILKHMNVSSYDISDVVINVKLKHRDKLRSLSNVKSDELIISHCDALTSISDIRAEKIKIDSCPGLTSISDIKTLYASTSLSGIKAEWVDIYHCSVLTSISGIRFMMGKVKINFCNALTSISDIKTEWGEIKIDHCPGLISISDINAKWGKIKIDSCHGLTSIYNIKAKKVKIKDCNALTSIAPGREYGSSKGCD